MLVTGTEESHRAQTQLRAPLWAVHRQLFRPTADLSAAWSTWAYAGATRARLHSPRRGPSLRRWRKRRCSLPGDGVIRPVAGSAHQQSVLIGEIAGPARAHPRRRGRSPSDARRTRREYPGPRTPHVTIGDLSGWCRIVDIDDEHRVADVVLAIHRPADPATNRSAGTTSRPRSSCRFEPHVEFVISPAWTTDWITDRGPRTIARRWMTSRRRLPNRRHVRRPAGPRVRGGGPCRTASDPESANRRGGKAVCSACPSRSNCSRHADDPPRRQRRPTHDGTDDMEIVDGSAAAAGINHDTNDSVIVTFDRGDNRLRSSTASTYAATRFDGRSPPELLAARVRPDGARSGSRIRRLPGPASASRPGPRPTAKQRHHRRDAPAPGHFTHRIDRSTRSYAALAGGGGRAILSRSCRRTRPPSSTQGLAHVRRPVRADPRCCSTGTRDVLTVTFAPLHRLRFTRRGQRRACSASTGSRPASTRLDRGGPRPTPTGTRSCAGRSRYERLLAWTSLPAGMSFNESIRR